MTEGSVTVSSHVKYSVRPYPSWTNLLKKWSISRSMTSEVSAVPCDADHDEGKQLGISEVVLDLKQRVKCRQTSPMKILAMFIHTHQSCPLHTVAVDEAEKKETDSGQNSHLHTPRYIPPGYLM